MIPGSSRKFEDTSQILDESVSRIEEENSSPKALIPSYQGFATAGRPTVAPKRADCKSAVGRIRSVATSNSGYRQNHPLRETEVEGKRRGTTMSFRDNLQHLRAERNMTQEQLAMLLGVSRQSVTKWEAERSSPELDKLLKMCQIFDCSLDDLVQGDLTKGHNETDERRTRRSSSGYLRLRRTSAQDGLEGADGHRVHSCRHRARILLRGNVLAILA